MKLITMIAVMVLFSLVWWVLGRDGWQWDLYGLLMLCCACTVQLMWVECDGEGR